LATEEQLLEGLRRADAAGNQADAQHFADQIKALRQFSAAQGQPTKADGGPNVLEDVARSADTGLAKGVAAGVGMFGDLGNILGSGMRAVGIPTRDTSQPLPANVTVPTQYNPPSSRDVNDAIQSVGGKYYEPKTVPGKYAEAITSFAPVAALPGSLTRRLLRVIVPATASETAGEITEGTPIEPYARGIAALATGAVPSVARTGLSMANRVAANVTGRGFLNPTTEAARRLSDAFAADGGLDTALEREASFQRSGASAPTVLDLGDTNVRRLVRAAAGGGGPAGRAATNYADRIRANFQDNVVERTNQLTPEYQGSAAALGAEMEANQGRLATEQYRAPYAQPATITSEMVDALQGRPGRAAIARAFAAAEARRDAQGMAELADLRQVAAAQEGGQNIVTGRFQTIGQALANLSARSLDRVRIAMREQGRALAASGANDIAGGYRGRVTDIDTALDQTPALTEARDSYRQMQAGRDSLDTGATVLSSPSTDYAGQIAELANRGASATLGPPNLGPGLRVGARNAITSAVEAPTAGATGVLNRIGTSNRATANLAATFGEGPAGRFQEAVRNEVARLRNANFISPETGSQTQSRLADEALVGGIPTSLGHLVSRIADKIFRGTQLTPQEREQIVRLGLSEADVRRFATQAPRVNRGPQAATVLNQSQATSGQ
jgi:hypothetical protein